VPARHLGEPPRDDKHEKEVLAACHKIWSHRAQVKGVPTSVTGAAFRGRVIDVATADLETVMTHAVQEESRSSSPERSKTSLAGFWAPPLGRGCKPGRLGQEVDRLWKPCLTDQELRHQAAVRIQAALRGWLARVELRRRARHGDGLVQVSVKMVVEDGDDGIQMIHGPKVIFINIRHAAAQLKLIGGVKPWQPLSGVVTVWFGSGVLNGDNVGRITFRWEFWPRPCAHLPEGAVFGPLRFSTLVWEPGTSSCKQDIKVSARFSVRTGRGILERWQTDVVDVVEGAAQWHTDRIFQIRNFCGRPLVTIEVEDSSEPSGSTPWGAAFMCLPPRWRPLYEDRELVVEPLGALVDSRAVELGSSLSDCAVHVRYKWSPRDCDIASPLDFVGDLHFYTAGWKDTAAVARKRPKLRIFVQSSAPTHVDGHAVMFPVKSSSGEIDRTVHVDWRTSSEHTKALDNFMEGLDAGEVKKLADRMQYQTWPFRRLAHSTFKRDCMWFACFKYSPLLTRKQRYAILSSAIMFGAFVTILLFRVDCFKTPKPAACKKKKSLVETLVSWDVVFGSIWAIALSVPLPLLLMTLFKKRVVQEVLTDEHKTMTMRVWMWKERVGWMVVVFVHTGSIFMMTQFVRHYPWVMMEKWSLATVTSVFHRLVSAPFIYLAWRIMLMMLSRYTSLLDCLLVLSPLITTFPMPAAPVSPGDAVSSARYADDVEDDGDGGADAGGGD